jgi:hypothetical protein
LQFSTPSTAARRKLQKNSKEQMAEDKAADEVDAKALKASFKISYKVILLTVSTMLDENGER